MPAKSTLLIVSTDANNSEALLGELQDEFNCVQVSDTALLREYDASQLDLIILESGSQGLNAFELCSELKSAAAFRAVPIIFLANVPVADEESRAVDLGAADFINNTLSMSLIKARIRSQIELKHKTDLLTEIALLDGLTCIPNLQRFQETLEVEWRRNLREFNDLSVVLIDIDDFSAFNDQYGAGSGDQVLKRVAQVIENNCLRAADLVARFDGDEFVALLPGIELENALKVAENICRAVAALGIENTGPGDAGVLTVSAGVATVEPTQDQNQAQLMEEVAEMLNSAQQMGGNQAQGIDL
jgi:diguanylate cyclase (GGDEF)-like protein